MKQRKIIHIDMDCFYAAIEMRDNPRLRGRPIAVGGRPDQRGVVATCSYEARAFGVHSAMPMAQAIKRCPDLIVIRPRMAVYQATSREIFKIFHGYTQRVQPLSLDEAFLDVSDCRQCRGSATLIAQEIRAQIKQKHGLTASAGIAPNKFLAKVGSDLNKPDGQYVILPEQIEDFVRQLPVKKIFGVGRVTAEKMHRLNIHTCGDLQAHDLAELESLFGQFGHRLHQLCRGIDPREVVTDSVRKSISVEDTFMRDLPDLPACLERVPDLFELLLERLAKAQKKRPLTAKNCYVKMRFNDFSTTTAQCPAHTPELRTYLGLIRTAWQRGQRPVRLIGLGLQFHPPATPQQLTLTI